MKRLALSFAALATLCHSQFTFAHTHWTGLYLGANAGYWASQDNDISSTGSPSFINPSYAPGSSSIAQALAEIGTQSTSLDPNGFIAGAQAGYNHEFSKKFLVGVSVDFDGLTHSNNETTSQTTVNLSGFDESYAASLAIKETINYLGTVRARLGYLFTPTLLLYATGGFAYGDLTLDTTWTAQESLGPAVFPTVTSQHSASQTLTGWTVGAGLEWLFNPRWSSMLEYTYYSLSDLTVTGSLDQTNASVSPAVLWGSAATETELSPSVWGIRLGVNYHF